MTTFLINLFLVLHDLNLNGLRILDFQMLSLETRNQRKKNGNVVRTLI